MMGERFRRRERLTLEFCLEDRVAANHDLAPDRCRPQPRLAQGRAEAVPKSYRPAMRLDPESMIRMLLIGNCHSIRSERRLCQEVELNLA